MSHPVPGDPAPGADPAPTPAGTPEPEPPKARHVMSEGVHLSAQELYNEVKSLRQENAKYRRLYKEHKDKADSVAADWQAKLDALQSQYDQLASEADELREDNQTFAEIIDSHFDYDGDDLTFRDDVIEALQEQLVPDAQARIAELEQQLTADPTSLHARIAELEGTIQQREHRDAWTKALDGELADGMDLDTLWRLDGYEPAGAVDEAALAERVKAAREARPFAFKASAPAADGQAPGGPNPAASPEGREPSKPKPQPLSSGLESGRGATGNSAAGRLQVSRSRQGDPAYMTPEFYQRVVEAQAEGTLDYID